MAQNSSRERLRIAHTALFWETLSEFRSSGIYTDIRSKLQQLIAYRALTGKQHPRETMFTSSALKGVWHFHLSNKPNVILFYTVRDNVLELRMLGDHSDYSWNRKNMSADQRTRNRIDKSSPEDVGSPMWPNMPRWTSPSEIARHPDLPELSPEALQQLQDAIEDELSSNGRRWNQIHRRILENEPESVVDAYLNDLINLTQTVEDIMTQKLGAHYDRINDWKRTGTKHDLNM